MQETAGRAGSESTGQKKAEGRREKAAGRKENSK